MRKKASSQKRNMPKNALSRPTAAALLSAAAAAALFCVVELAFARETQYFYNSVTGEVRVVRATSLFRESVFFVSLSRSRFVFVIGMIASLDPFFLGSLERGGVTETTTTARPKPTRERSFLFSMMMMMMCFSR